MPVAPAGHFPERIRRILFFQRKKNFADRADRGEIGADPHCIASIAPGHCRNGILRAFYGTPSLARNLTFDNMFAPGGFRISGRKIFDRKTSLRILATRNQTLKIQMPGTAVFEKAMKQGEILYLIREQNTLIPADRADCPDYQD